MKKKSSRIAHNSFWFSIETALEAIVFFGTSVAVARYLGPTKLGYFSYINFFIAVVQRTGGNGLSLTTRKYMSEYVAKNRLGAARAMYDLSYRYQLIYSVSVATLGVVSILLFGDVHYRVMSCILMVSIVPGLMSWAPAQANQAFEDVANNTISAFGYLVSYAVVIALTVYFQWDLVGVASATLIGRTIEVTWRTIPLHRTLSRIVVEPLDKQVKRDVRRFCLQAIGVQLIATVVFERTELFFLRAFSTLEQIAFYSVSASLGANLLTPPRVLASAAGVTMMVDAVRDPKRVNIILRNTSKYSLLMICPLALGAMAVAPAAVKLVYGAKYLGAVPALLAVMPLIIPKVFQWAPDLLLRIADKQNRLMFWFGMAAVVNVILDWALIPRYGSVGAAFGNGLGQLFALVVTWLQARRSFDFEFPLDTMVRITLAAACMAGIAFGISHYVPGRLGMAAAITTGVLCYPLLIRISGALDREDLDRLTPVGNRLPQPIRRGYLAFLSFATAR